MPENTKQFFDVPKDAVKFSMQERPGKMPLLTGYAIVWNTLSSDRGGYKVTFQRGSAKPAPGDIFALCNHDYSQVVGRSGNCTLSMEPDAYGMKCVIDPADTTYARDMVALIRRGDVKGMSFGMLGAGAAYKERRDHGQTVLDYSSFLFDEVTLTAIPAFEQTCIASEFARGDPSRPALAIRKRRMAMMRCGS